LVDPVLVDPVLVDPVSAPSAGVAAGLVPLAPPGPGELDAGDAGDVGFEVLLLAGVDTVALGLAAWDGFAEPVVVQGIAVGLADFLPPVALVLAFADAFEVAPLMVVALAVPVAVGVAVAVSPGLVLPPTGLPLDPLSVGLLAGLLAALLTGVTLGVTDLAGLAAADDGEVGAHTVAPALLWVAAVPP
jgi:hypothetical protein